MSLDVVSRSRRCFSWCSCFEVLPFSLCAPQKWQYLAGCGRRRSAGHRPRFRHGIGARLATVSGSRHRHRPPDDVPLGQQQHQGGDPLPRHEAAVKRVATVTYEIAAVRKCTDLQEMQRHAAICSSCTGAHAIHATSADRLLTYALGFIAPAPRLPKSKQDLVSTLKSAQS